MRCMRKLPGGRSTLTGPNLMASGNRRDGRVIPSLKVNWKGRSGINVSPNWVPKDIYRWCFGYSRCRMIVLLSHNR